MDEEMKKKTEIRRKKYGNVRITKCMKHVCSIHGEYIQLRICKRTFDPKLYRSHCPYRHYEENRLKASLPYTAHVV